MNYSSVISSYANNKSNCCIIMLSQIVTNGAQGGSSHVMDDLTSKDYYFDSYSHFGECIT